jgi:hypothetical protein
VKLDADDVTCETVRFSPPVFVRVSLKLWLLPICTLPKVRLVGLAVRSPGVTPLPESAISTVALEALSVIESIPLLAPAALGVKTTPNVLL